MEVMEATPGCSIATNFNSSQCIFYPVKEEEREVLLGTSESDSRPVSSGVSSVTLQSEQHTTGSHLKLSSYILNLIRCHVF